MRIGLTNQVVWPFYDAARDRLEIQLTEPGFDTEVEEAIGGELTELTMVVPANQAYRRDHRDRARRRDRGGWSDPGCRASRLREHLGPGGATRRR